VLTKAGFRVTLLDANLYSTFQPLLYQVATAGLNPGDVSYPVGGIVSGRRARRGGGTVFRRGDLVAVDPGARSVKLEDGRELSYDYLILATGVSANYFGVKGAAENTFGLYTRRDALVLRDHIMAGIERLSETVPSQQDGDLHVTVVGGGATGVELAGTLAELRKEVFRNTFPDIDPGRLHVRLVEQGDALLGPFAAPLRDYTLGQLRRRDVEVTLGAEIREVTSGHVLLASGDALPSDITVWAAGVAAPDAVASWGLPQGKHGRILVGPDLRVQGQERIFAAGDIAVNPDDPTPQLAQPAIQMGKHAARQVIRLADGQPTTTFRYHDKGIMATIGRKSAVVQLPDVARIGGLRIRGTLAWLAWLGLHLIYLLGGRNRISTMINLSWRYLAWGHGGGVIVGDDPQR
jgi:NADH:ubiquinone reductase (H+-translocating)